VKLALWAAAVSPMMRLDRNGTIVRLLAPYVTQPLPDDPTALYTYLAQSGAWIRHNLIRSLYAIEACEREGKLPAMPGRNWSREQWIAWRNQVAKLPGLGLKTASFAGLLLRPMTCELVPVDRHVLARLGFDTDKSPASVRAYNAVEQLVVDERARYGYAHVSLGVWHWLKWSEYRQSIERAG
jgi:hypothetical protein